MSTILEQEHGPELGPAPTLAHLVGAVLVQGYLQRLGIVTVNVVSTRSNYWALLDPKASP